MTIEAKHPQVTFERAEEWALMRLSMMGESDIKSAGTTYLPMPSGFKGHDDGGTLAYSAYKERAQFPEIVAPSIAAMVGMVHAKESQIEIPPQLEYLYESATDDGQTLEAFHRQITRELLTVGRYGILTDAPEDGGNPFFVGYTSEAIRNWDDDWFILDESGYFRDGRQWKFEERYRELSFDGGYRQIFLVKGGVDSEIEPSGLGGTRIERIPFAVAGATSVLPDLCAPPLIGVARAAKAIYQLSADYRWQLYMSGQETLVAINGDAPTHVGAGVVHQMMGTDTMQPDLKYVSPSCSGIEAHKEAMQEQRDAAVMAGARLFDNSERGQESGEARKLRFASETATLMSISLNSAALLERALKDAAMILGADEGAVVVTPPDDLMDHSMTAQEVQALVAAWQSGGFSYQTLYENLQRGGVASMERDHDEEYALLLSEEVDGARRPVDPAMLEIQT